MEGESSSETQSSSGSKLQPPAQREPQDEIRSGSDQSPRPSADSALRDFVSMVFETVMQELKQPGGVFSNSHFRTDTTPSDRSEPTPPNFHRPLDESRDETGTGSDQCPSSSKESASALGDLFSMVFETLMQQLIQPGGVFSEWPDESEDKTRRILDWCLTMIEDSESVVSFRTDTTPSDRSEPTPPNFHRPLREPPDETRTGSVRSLPPSEDSGLGLNEDDLKRRGILRRLERLRKLRQKQQKQPHKSQGELPQEVYKRRMRQLKEVHKRELQQLQEGHERELQQLQEGHERELQQLQEVYEREQQQPEEVHEQELQQYLSEMNI